MERLLTRLVASRALVDGVATHVVAGFVAVALVSWALPEFDNERVSVAVHQPFVAMLFLAAVLATAAVWLRLREDPTDEGAFVFLAFAGLAGIYSPHALLEGSGPDPAHLVFGPASRAFFAVFLFAGAAGARLPRRLVDARAAALAAAVLVLVIDAVLHAGAFRDVLLGDPITVLRRLEWVAVVAQVAALTALAVRWRRIGSRFLAATGRAMAVMVLSSLLFLSSTPWTLRWWVAHAGLVAAAAILVAVTVHGRAVRGSLAGSVDFDAASSVADLLIDRMETGVVIVDHRGEVVGWNPAATALTGWDRQQAVDSLPELVDGHVVDLGQATVRVRQHLIERLGHRLQVSFLADVGRELELQEENERLDRLAADLREAVDAKNRLVGMVSHELRTPLTAVQGFAQVLISRVGPQLQEMEEMVLRRIAEASGRMGTMIDDLLTISAGEKGGTVVLELDRSWCDLRTITRETVEVNRPSASGKQMSILLDVPTAEVLAHVDGLKFDQVLTNLVSNAVKYSPLGATIWVRLHHDAGEVVLEVQDEGPGIPADELGQLFEPFGRTSVRPTGDERSTGLGLAIVRHIVEAHGGGIEVDSEVGRGSTFTVRLPRDTADGREQDLRRSAAASPSRG